MNPIDVINRFVIERQNSEHQINQLLARTYDTLPILNEEYYFLAEQISQISGFEDIAEAFLTSENPAKIDPQALLQIWNLASNALPQLLPDLNNSLCQHLKQLFQNLSLQYESGNWSSAAWITGQIKNLERGKSFKLPLPHKTAEGKSLETVVMYQKNEDDTLDIKLFHAKEGCWNDQGGEYALGYEKSHPVRYFSHVPYSNLFGPAFDGQSCIHAKTLLKAAEDSNQGPDALIAAFSPLNSYLKRVEQHGNPVSTAHAHSLKGIHAFLYTSIAENSNSGEALNNYKACLCVFRLVLSIAIMKSFAEEDQADTKFGMLAEAAFTAARHLEKQKDNPIIRTIHEAAAGTLEQLKERAERLQRARIPDDNCVKNRKIAHDQAKLMKKALEESRLFLSAAGPTPDVQKLDMKYTLHDLLAVDELPVDHAKFFPWLHDAEEKLKDISDAYPDMLLPVMNSLIAKFDLPGENSLWLKMDDSQRRQCLKIISRLSELLSKTAFQQQLRFSLEVQNSGARLLLIAQGLAESLDGKKILAAFRPALKGYIKLTSSPYFQGVPYSAWQQRQELLFYMQTKEIKERKSAWRFTQKKRMPFNQTPDGVFADAILEAYPEINRAIEEQLRSLRKRKGCETFYNMVPGQLLLAELLHINVQDNVENVLDFGNDDIQALSSLAQTAMHVHLLSDMNARPHIGYEHAVAIRDGLSFDLVYAKQHKTGIDFLAGSTKQKLSVGVGQRNLFPKEKWAKNQNETLQHFASRDEVASDEWLSFEESACEPELAPLQLLSKFKSKLSHFDDFKIRSSFERYLFKIIVAKDGTEKFLLGSEMAEYPHVFNELLQDFLDAAAIFSKYFEQGISGQSAAVFAFTSRLFAVAQALSCQPVLQTLKKFHEQMKTQLKECLENRNDRQQPQQTADLKVFLLKILELHPSDTDWKDYFKWGSRLQEQLEQKDAILEPFTQLWWNQMRFKMAQRFHALPKDKLNEARKHIDEANFDVLGMSHGKGKWQQIPSSVLKNPEFIRLFSDRIRFWKVDEESQRVTFSDPLTGKYQLTNNEHFPQNLQRLIEGVWHVYIPYAEVVKTLHVSESIRQESIWWLHPASENLKAKGYYKARPDQLWLEREKDGAVLFRDGEEKGMRLELVENEGQSLSDLEKNTGLFGSHYYAFHARYLEDSLIEFRDLLCFPHVRTEQGKKLLFKRHGLEFYEQGNLEREFGCVLFAPSSYDVDDYHTKHKSTPLRLYGIQIKKKNSDALRNKEEMSILLPLQRHVSDPHSHMVHALTHKVLPDSPSYLTSVDVMEMKVDSLGFCPETPRENLFAAYLSLIGKDYHAAAKCLGSLRPNHRINEQERQILKWLIDSKEDAQDHSAAAASIKLLAYKILGEQGISLSDEFYTKDLPSESLETVYREYLNHAASVPTALRVPADLEAWILGPGFECFPPSREHQNLWDLRKADLIAGHRTVKAFHLPEPKRMSLFEQWSECSLSETQTDLEISGALIEGIKNPTEHPLQPGKTYPQGAFGYHYNKLLANELSDLDKWELLYALESTAVPEWLKVPLKIAFQKGREAPALPSLNKKSHEENSQLVRNWLQNLYVYVSVPANTVQKQIDEITKEHLLNTRENLDDQMTSNKNFAQKIVNTVHEVKATSPYEFIESLKDSFASHSEPAAFEAAIECPFDETEEEVKSMKEEVKAYRKEWKKGLDLHHQSRRYPIPELGKIEELHKILEMYPNEVSIHSLQRDILRILNRRPLHLQAGAKARLAEVAENKVDMNLEDALKTIFMPDAASKLTYLKKKNPFLVEEDLEALNKCLQEYLEQSISDKLLGQVKNKLQPILEIAENEGLQWKDNPSVQEAWQEIGELLNPFDEYSDDPQKHLETLLFEHLCGFRIREEQAAIMHELVEKIFNENASERDFAVVFQMIMGGGKTSVILAQMAKLAAQNGKVPIFLAHHSQYPSLRANLVNTQFKRLNQDVVDIDFNREDLASLKILKYINSQLTAAQDNGRLLLMKTSFLLTLRLEFIDQIKLLKDPQNLDPFNLERIKELAKILLFIKENSLLLGDEVDCGLNILEEVNFPAGLSAVISKGSLDLIKQVYAILSTRSDISALLKLDEDDQSLVSRQKLSTEIFPALVDALIDDYPPLSELIPPQRHRDFREALKDYMLGKIDARLMDRIESDGDETGDAQFFDSLILSEQDRRKARLHLEFLRHLYSLKENLSETSRQGLNAAALAKELCTEILPVILGKSYNRNYGFSEDGKVIPYLGVDSPNQTEFGNIYVTACCYFQAALQQGIDIPRLKQYRDKLREASVYYSELYHCRPEESSEAQHFKALTGLELHQNWSEEDLNLAIDEMNHDPQRRLDFYAEYASVFLRYHTSLLNGGPITLANMGGQFIGCSAILWNREAFARKIAENSLLQKGTEGRILVKLAQDLVAEKCFLSLIDKAEPHHILNAVLEKREDEEDAPQRLRALVDACGMLKRYSNREVADEILKFAPLENEIDAVVFLNKVGDSKSFCLLKRGETKPIPLLTTSRGEIEKNGVVLDRVFIYFDQLRATGSDVPFKANGIVAKTFDPFSTSMRDDLQADLRARNFFHAQTVDTIIQRAALEGFVNYNKESPETCLNAKNFFLTAVRNQIKLKQTQLLRSALEQIKEAYCSVIVRKLVNIFIETQEETVFEDAELFSAAEWLFYNTFKDDPVALFMDLQKDVPAYEIVQRYLDCSEQRFQESSASYLDPSDLEAIKLETENIITWSNETLTWMVPSTDLNTHLEKQVTVQTQHENQLEVNIEIQKETQKELQKYAVRVDAPAAQTISWEKLKDHPRSFKDYKNPGLITFRKFLKRVPYQEPYHQVFPKDLYLTENLSRSHENDLPVFHKAQKNAYHILLVKDGDNFRPLFVDLKEAAFWRKQIKQYALNDCWLCDLDGHSLNEGWSVPDAAAAVLRRAQWWGHFFNGNASYLRTYPSLIQQELKNENYELKYRFLVLKAAYDPLQTKVLFIDPLLSKAPIETGVFQFNDKKAVEDSLLEDRKDWDEEKLNQLPFQFARFVSKEQVPLLKRKGYFSYLPADKFDFIRPEQVSLIPVHRLQYLKLQEQVAEVPPEKIYYLKGAAVGYLTEEFIDRIDPKELENLLPDLQIKYQHLQIERMSLEIFARSVEPCMASAILPECVPFISTDCLPCLETSEQLKYVPTEKYHLLKACQFHLLPRENWPLLLFEDYKKYHLEKIVPSEAAAFIQQMNAEWVNDMDPRLAKFYAEPQVRKISQPKPIAYLQQHQLCWLSASLAAYLDPFQVSELSSQHNHLIETFDDPKVLAQLSRDALQKLSAGQVQIIDDRETLLRLDAKFYPHLLLKQIHLLQPEHAEDKKIIKHLEPVQLKGLERMRLAAFLPYLNETALKTVEASILCEVAALSYESRRKLTPHQMQCFLVGQKNQKHNITKILKELSAYQWNGMDRIFIESFFAKLRKTAIQCVPKTHVRFLPKAALIKWHNADLKKNVARDILTGICSIVFYPLILINALMLGLFAQQKKASWQKTFRKMALSPLRFLDRESYYRITSD